MTTMTPILAAVVMLVLLTCVFVVEFELSDGGTSGLKHRIMVSRQLEAAEVLFVLPLLCLSCISASRLPRPTVRKLPCFLGGTCTHREPKSSTPSPPSPPGPRPRPNNCARISQYQKGWHHDHQCAALDDVAGTLLVPRVTGVVLLSPPPVARP